MFVHIHICEIYEIYMCIENNVASVMLRALSHGVYVYVFMCGCICVCVHVCMCVCVRACVRTHGYMRARMCLSVHISIHEIVNIYTNRSPNAPLRKCACCVYVCVHVGYMCVCSVCVCCVHVCT